MGHELADRLAPRPVTEHALIHAGRVWDIRSDVVDLGPTQVVREYVDHPGAVAIIALDEDDRVLLVSQYRHPVRSELWEPPAGLLDVVGEPPLLAAARELAEEADLRADRWHVLLDFYTTPGGSSERIEMFLARGLHEIPEGERHTRTDEEAEMVSSWVPLDEAVDAIFAGRLRSPTAVVGVLAAVRARERGWDALRPAGTPA